MNFMYYSTKLSQNITNTDLCNNKIMVCTPSSIIQYVHDLSEQHEVVIEMGF